MKIRRQIVWTLVLGMTSLAFAAEKKIITYSWGTGSSSPAELLEKADELDKIPVDGFTIAFKDVKRPTGEWLAPRQLRSDPEWRYEDFAPQVPVVRELLTHKSFKESLIRGWSVLDKRVDWRDDEAWARFAHNFGVLAALVRDCGSKGVVIDHEDYHKIKQFFRLEGDPEYDELVKIARRRGAEVFREAFREYPDMVVLSFWLLSLPFDERYCCAQPDLPGIARAKGDVWPAFFNGILDALPPEATLVDGCEHGYNYEFFRGDFFRGAALQRTGLLPLVAPENRRKYRNQLRAGFGLYAANYYNDRKARHFRWWFCERNGSRLGHWEANLNQAFEAADEYVWIFTEVGTWIDWGQETIRKRTRRADAEFFPLESKVPGFCSAIEAVKDPLAWGEKRIGEMRAKGRLVDLVASGEAERNEGKGYAVWRVKGVRPGERYAYDVTVRGGKDTDYFTTKFMKPESEKEQVLWMASRDTLYRPQADGTRRAFDVVRVPDTGAEFMDGVVVFSGTNTTHGVESVESVKVYRIPLIDEPHP